MGYELDRMMQQYGFSTPVLSYSGMSMPVKPGDIATGASAMEKANYDALLAKYNADMPLYTSDQDKYKTYSTEYNNRLANTSMYDAPQFQKSAMSSPGAGAFTDQYSQMYQDVLGRAPDATGLAYWKGKFGDMISPEEYAQFRQSAAAEIGSRPINTLPVTTPRAILNQPTYSTPTAAPVLQTAATTTPYVLPVDNSGRGNDGGGLNDGSGGGGGGLGVGPGQGVSSQTQNTALGLMAFADKYPVLAPLGFLAKGLGFIGGKLADSQMDKMAEAQKALEAIDAQNAAALASGFSRSFDPYAGTKGVMSVTDVNGNVKSFDPYAGDSKKDAGRSVGQGSGTFNSSNSVDSSVGNDPTGGDLGGPADSNSPFASGGYIGSYAHGGAVRHYQAGGDVMSKMAEADQLIKALEGGKLTGYEREDAMSRVAEIYRMLDEEAAQAAPTPSGGDLIQPMPESVPVMAQEPKQRTISQISQAIANAKPLTTLKEMVENKPITVESAPSISPRGVTQIDPRLYGETNEVATGKGYSPLDPRLYGETNEVATGKGYSPLDPRLFGETNEVASGPGYSMPVVAQAAPPAVDQKLLDLAAKYTKPGFVPTFAQGSIDPGADQMALISRTAMENKIANPVVNIQPEHADDSASRLSGAAPQDAAIPMSPNMVMLQKMLLANQSQPSPYADELRAARTAATAQTKAFNDMLERAIKGQDDNKPSNAETYFRLAAAFGAPTKTGNFFESLAEVNKSMADQVKETRLAGKAGQALRLQLGLEGAKAGMTAAKEDVTSLRALTNEEMKEKSAYGRELIKEYFKSGEAQSAAGKQAQDEGLIPGTPKYQARVTAISDEQFKRLTAGVDASVAAAQASLASIGKADEAARLAREKFDAAQAKTKADAAKLSPPELKLKIETEDMIGTTQQAMDNLRRAYALNPTTFDNSLPDLAQRKILEAAGSKDPKVIATRELENILERAALSALKATFPGAISDGERKALMNTVGLGAKSIEERKLIMESGYEALKSVSERSKKRLKLINEGLYRTTTPAITEETE